MARKILILCCILTVASVLLSFCTRLFELPAYLFTLGKISIIVWVLASLAIALSLLMLGNDQTAALLTNALLLITTAVLVLIPCELGVRFISNDITTTGDNSSYFARKWHKNNLRFNSFGFREKSFNHDKPIGTYRIAVIGDSFTFGQGIAEKDRYTNLLQNFLNDKGVYQILNFGKPGAETIDHLAILRDVVLKAEPDFVILQWYVNDVEGNDKSKRPKPLPLLPSVLGTLFHRSSALYYLINHRWQSFQIDFGLLGSYEDYMRQRFSDPQCTDSLKARAALTGFINECMSRNIGLAVVLFPHYINDLGSSYPFDYLHQRVLELCHMHNTLCLDLRSTFSPYQKDKKLWVNRFDAHPNAFANRLVAGYLIKTLSPLWLPAGKAN